MQRKLGITTIYVTYDQSEALAISDSIISMNHGIVVQNLDPRTIYDRPYTRFVADFVGTNILPVP